MLVTAMRVAMMCAGTPVLEMRQIVRDRAQRPLLTSAIRYAGDRYRLRTSFMRSF